MKKCKIKIKGVHKEFTSQKQRENIPKAKFSWFLGYDLFVFGMWTLFIGMWTLCALDKRNKKNLLFKKDAGKYNIENNNLYYKYNTRKVFENRKIPFKEELPILLNYLHLTNNLSKSEEMISLIDDLKYYWLWFTSDII